MNVNKNGNEERVMQERVEQEKKRWNISREEERMKLNSEGIGLCVE